MTINERSWGPLWASGRYYFEQLSRRHPGWLMLHAVVLVHFLMNYQLGLLFAWWVLALLPIVTINLVPVHLPIPRRQLFAFSLVPALIVGLAGGLMSVEQTQSTGIGTGSEFDLRSSPVKLVEAPSETWST